MADWDRVGDPGFTEDEQLYDFEVSNHDQHEWADVDLEITDMPTVKDVHFEHTVLDYSDLDDVLHVHLVKEHFPQLKDSHNSEHTANHSMQGSCMLALGIALATTVWLRRSAKHSSGGIKDNKVCIHDVIATLDFSSTLDLLDETAAEVKEARSGNNITYSVEKNFNTLNALACSLFEHICVDGEQFESILSDHIGSEASAKKKVDPLEVISSQLNTIMEVLDSNSCLLETSFSSKSGRSKRGNKSLAAAVVSTELSVHVEDRLVQHATQRMVSGLRVQFTCIKDSLLRICAISDKKHTKDIFDRLRAAVESKNMFNLVDSLIILEETDARLTNHPEYRTGSEVLSGIYEEEDRVVREREENKFRMHQQDIINTFQKLSLNGSARDDADSFGNNSNSSGKSLPGTSIKHSAHCNFSEPIIIPGPGADTGTAAAGTGNKTDAGNKAGTGPGVGVGTDGFSQDSSKGWGAFYANVSAPSTDNPSVPVSFEPAPAPAPIPGFVPAPPTVCADGGGEERKEHENSSTVSGEPFGATGSVTSPRSPSPPLRAEYLPLSPQQEQRQQQEHENYLHQQQQQVTLHHRNNSGSLSPHGSSRTPLDNNNNNSANTSLLISSQWAMEALKLRRDSEAAVERALLEIHRRRDRLEQNSRAGARRNIEERSREVRGARLFLESIKTQQETQRNAEETAFQQGEQLLVREFQRQRKQQQVMDARVFRWVYLAAAVLYLLALTRFDPSKGGVYSLGSWVLDNLWNACQFLSCDASATTHSAVVQYAGRSGAAHATTAAAAGTRHTGHPSPLILTLPGGLIDSESATALVSSYQANYRTATQYVQSAFSTTLTGSLTSAVRHMVVNSIFGGTLDVFSRSSSGAGAGAGVGGVLLGSGRCAMHVLMRSLPALLVRRLLAFLGLKSLSGIVGTMLSVLCFSDILLQMALGPLLPLFLVGVAHAVVYYLLRRLSRNKLRWLVGGRDIRWLVVYILYSLFILRLVWVVGTV